MDVRRLVAAVLVPAAAVIVLAAPSAASPDMAVAGSAGSTPAGQVEFVARFTVTVKCQLVENGGGTVGYITGTGSGKTKPDAVKAAKKDADKSVPQAHYKRHCKEI
ncbi:hypothetical protein [Nocardia sp. bgisy118]|uniref:hypothetical protein n=1 Tax=Nocardia sp. bgisy118 TaxID=3413786 RepID=UPI003F4A6FD9